MEAIVVLIPVLARPHRVAPLLESLAGVAWRCRPLFLVSPDDSEEEAAIDAAGAEKIVVDWPAGQGDYARKINAGFAASSEPFVFLGADDLVFDPGWADRAVAKWEETGAGVIGTNDLGNSRVISGEHATHPLVHRSYGELGTIDDPALLLHEGYFHNYVDDEFVQTAKFRGQYAPASDSLVEHLHPSWGKADDDDTYRRAIVHFSRDRDYFDSRRGLWGNTDRF